MQSQTSLIGYTETGDMPNIVRLYASIISETPGRRYTMGWKKRKKCPKCGSPLHRDGKSYSCTNTKCDWRYSGVQHRILRQEKVGKQTNVSTEVLIQTAREKRCVEYRYTRSVTFETTPRLLIQKALLIQGWLVKNRVCPECNRPLIDFAGG